jgi:eukaryotic-like serine/threonine-protein kinase
MRPPSASRQRYCPFCDAYTAEPRCGEHLVETVDLGGRPVSPVHAESPAGTVFANRFELHSVLGIGQSGTIFEARQISMDRAVALKVLRAEFLREHGALRRFYSEVRSATMLEHPNIVRIFDFGVDEATHQPFIAMNLIAGQSLAAILADGPISEARAAAILAQVARALVAAHGKGIVHRDLKPENILISRLPDGMEHATVIDFGTAKNLDVSPRGPGTGERLGGLFGTPLYMSPEQISGIGSDGRADLYALGCILHECVSGQPPFEADNVLACLLAHLEVKPPPLPALLTSGLAPSSALSELTRWLLMKQRDYRPKSAHLVVEILSRLGAGDQASAIEILDGADLARGSPGDRTTEAAAIPDEVTLSEATMPSITVETETGRAVDLTARGAVLTLPAAIDGDFAFEIEAVKDKAVVVFDFDRVRRITSFGVREWTHFLKQLAPNTYYCFVRCHSVAIAQINLVTDFAGRGELLTLFAPYECAQCGDRVELLVDVIKEKANIERLAVPSLRCARCLIPFDLDEPAAVYFAHVIASKKPTPPRAVLDLLSGVASPQGSRDFLVTKEVDGNFTIFCFTGLIDDRASFRRLADGVEGPVLLDFDGLHGIVGGGFAKLVHFLRQIEDPIYVVNAELELLEQVVAAPHGEDIRFAMIEGRATCEECGTVRGARVGNREGGTCCGRRLRAVAALERLASRRTMSVTNEAIERYLSSTRGGR